MIKPIFTITAFLLFIGLTGYTKGIDKELLTQKFHPLDSTASAAYIKKNVEIEYNFDNPLGLHLEMKYHFVIKIYNEDGESYGTFQVPYYEKGGKKEKVRKIKAQTYNLVNGKIKSEQLSKKDIYKEETSGNWRKVTFALPNVKPGSVIEVQYTVSSPYVYSIPKWYFQNSIPTDYSSYIIDVPEYFTLTPVPTGSVLLSNEKKPVMSSQHGEIRHTLIGTKIKPYKKDKYVLNENDYRSGIKFELFSTKFPNRPTEYYSKDWNAIATNLNEADYFGRQIKKKLSDLNSIVEEALTIDRKDRALFLYEYVRSNYTWNENYGIGSYDGLKKVVSNKSGGVGDINLLLVNLLKKSNLVAHPVVMKSRYDGLLNTSFPTLTELDYCIVYVELSPDEYILLDATSKLTPMGELPLRALNISGVVVRPDGAKIINMVNNNQYKVQTVSEYDVDVENNTLIGSSQRKRSNYAATKFRADLEKENNEIDEEEDYQDEEGEQEDDIESYNLDNTYEVISLKNLEDIYKPISLEYKEELYTCSKIIGNKIFIDGSLDFGIKDNPFKEENREYPIFYNNKVSTKSIAAINIPEGYIIESIPESTSVTTPTKAATFRYDVKQQDGKLIIYYIFSVKQTNVGPGEYPALKNLYKIAADKAAEKIVLTKV